MKISLTEPNIENTVDVITDSSGTLPTKGYDDGKMLVLALS